MLAIALLAISAGFAGSAKAAAAAVPGPGDVLFSDDFSSGTPAKWTITQNASNWSVVNGQLRFNVAQCNVVSDAVAGETWWRDYAVDYDVTDIGVDDHVGVRAGSGAEAAILLLRRPNWIPARVRLYYDAIGPHDYTFDSLTSGVKNHVRVEVLGQTITTFVDGQKVFQTEDPNPASSGKMYLGVNSGAWCSADVRFDNVVVTSLSNNNFPAGPAVIYLQGISSKSTDCLATSQFGSAGNGQFSGGAPRWLNGYLADPSHGGVTRFAYFSYSGQYCDGGDGANGAWPMYASTDTCGVIDTSDPTYTGSTYYKRLKDLVSELVRTGGTSVTFVGHSQGGLIASYFLAQLSTSVAPADVDLMTHINGVVTFDSFPEGLIDGAETSKRIFSNFAQACSNAGVFDQWTSSSYVGRKIGDVLLINGNHPPKNFYTLAADAFFSIGVIWEPFTRIEGERLHRRIAPADHGTIWTFNFPAGSPIAQLQAPAQVQAQQFVACAVQGKDASGCSITPLPQQVITSDPRQGTSLQLDGKGNLYVPPGAVPNYTTFIDTPLSQPSAPTSPLQSAGVSIKLDAVDLSTNTSVTVFSQPLTLTLSYQDSALQSAAIGSPQQLGIYYLDAQTNTYQLVPGSVVDPALHAVTAPLTHFTEFALLAAPVVNHAPEVNAGGPYSVLEGGSTTVTGSAVDADGDGLSLAWDLDNDGTYETAGQSATFSAASLDGPTSGTIRLRACDSHSACTISTATIEVTNVAPTAIFGNSGPVNEGSSFTLSLTNVSDPYSADTAAGFSYAFDCGAGGGYSAYGGATTVTCPTTDDGTRSVKSKIRDKDGGETEYTTSLRVTNAAPTAALGNGGPVLEGSPATVSFASPSDPSSSDTVGGFRYAFDCTGGPLAGATYATASAAGSVTCTFVDNGTYMVRGRILDKDDGASEYTTSVVVTNVAPGVKITGPISGAVVAAGAAANFTGTFSDPGKLDTHTAQWSFDGTARAGVVSESGGNGTVTLSYTFAAAGVYSVVLAVTDKDGATGTATTVADLPARVVVYEPTAGFVTGGGWIASPAGACREAMVPGVCTGSPAGTKASFGFVSKYQRGATVPTGETEFQFQAGNLAFTSSSYQWLVVSGARAQYKGTGTINGQGTYTFLLTATDGDVIGGGDVDKFRIKITDASGAIVYDNLLGAEDGLGNGQPLGGGSIMIHS